VPQLPRRCTSTLIKQMISAAKKTHDEDESTTSSENESDGSSSLNMKAMSRRRCARTLKMQRTNRRDGRKSKAVLRQPASRMPNLATQTLSARATATALAPRLKVKEVKIVPPLLRRRTSTMIKQMISADKRHTTRTNPLSLLNMKAMSRRCMTTLKLQKMRR
jgi:hypothetical protein